MRDAGLLKKRHKKKDKSYVKYRVVIPEGPRIKSESLDFIRDLLGHSSVQTTEIYAKVSSARQRRAIEAASKEIVPEEDALWENSTSIKDWLKGLCAHKVM